MKVADVSHNGTDELKVGQMMEVSAVLLLGGLAPQDFKVEIYHGGLDSQDTLLKGQPAPMEFTRMEGDKAIFTGQVPLLESGRHGFSVRAIPSHPDLYDRIEPGLTAWS